MTATELQNKLTENAGTIIGEPVIEVRNLDAHYGETQVLYDVSLAVADGEIMVIMGGSGSGKTTLLRHLIGLEVPTAGTLELLGQELDHLGRMETMKLRRQIGVAFQGGAMFSSLSVSENIKLPLREHTRLDETTMDIMARMKLEVVNLSGFGDLMPAELSGGMLKRAAVARAIVMDPKLLFFDEPSAGLDPVVSAALDELILRLRDAMLMTVVVVTHEVESALKIADRITILDAGRIVEVDTPKAIRNSANPRVQNLLNRRSEEQVLDPDEYLRRLTGTGAGTGTGTGTKTG
jgi:phospholipid/cholesterol/gamma-HCH transport system ATP-binding protein